MSVTLARLSNVTLAMNYVHGSSFERTVAQLKNSNRSHYNYFK